MDSYLIRIYRKKDDDPKLLVGTAEKIGIQGKVAFNTLSELWAILNPRNRGPLQHGMERTEKMGQRDST